MKKLINLGLFLSFFLCYLEWGGGQSIFIAQAAYELVFVQGLAWNTALHPVILSCILGMLALLYSVVVKLSKPLVWMEWVTQDSPAISTRRLTIFSLFLVFLRIGVRPTAPADG